ncbi:MAG: tetratricopeptide repeat protein [Pseudanabaenaceae cyanobacterium bins.39]|nr:tetratricopeptide repeat protein [Pseudanabaenaceae cyanobacterium bins.39]
MSLQSLDSLESLAYEHFIQGEYNESLAIYEQIIAAKPSNLSSYCYLGLCQLLLGRIEEAQMTWFSAFESISAEQIDIYTDDLVQILEAEAQRQKELEAYDQSLAIRNCLIDIVPHSLKNLGSIVDLQIKLKTFTDATLTNLGILELLNSEEYIPLEADTLLDFIERIFLLTDCNSNNLDIVKELCIVHDQYKADILNRISIVSSYLHEHKRQDRAIQIAEMGLALDPENLPLLRSLVDFYLYKDNQKSILKAQKLYEISLNSHALDRVIACESMTRALIVNCLHWEDARKFYQEEYSKNLIELLNSYNSEILGHESTTYLMTTGFYYPYFDDIPHERHPLMRSVRQIANQKFYQDYQSQIEEYKKRLILRKRSYIPERPLRIGYLSSCFRRHSVGYLARWLIQNHNHESFEIYGYMGESQDEDILRSWYTNQFHKAYTDKIPNHPSFASQIQKDGIDILIDIDSITYPCGAMISSLKPAPVQATWLGWDALDQENIDYFIADPYSLPDEAQEYYTEKIWRLPQTYIAIDGFESATPTVRRDLLDIPDNAVIYFSAQTSMKRHPDTIRLQMKIIKSVPNSYLVLKGAGDQDSLKEFFYQMAELEGVSNNRLRFLPITNSEAEHRANLIIADVILDTYPYNGATHTLETLWMGIPMVTRVGEQFSARNSYTMMINAGINEGIAWTDEEYVDWGIRLGTDVDLRNQVILKLRHGRQTAPLWNSRQFTKDMENAYKQMWQIWLDAEDPDIEIDPVVDQDIFIAEAELRNADGIRLAQKGKTDAAIACWRSAISLYPNYVDAHYNLGIALSESGNLDLAISSFQTVIQLDPKHNNALYNLGLTFSKINQLDAAISAYNLALGNNSQDIDIYLAIGSAFFKKGEWESSLAAYQSALAINPNSGIALGGLGISLIELGDLAQAIECLQAGLSLNPDDAQLYCNLGHAFARARQSEDAAFCYQKALKLNPVFGHAYWNFNNDILADIDNPIHRNFKLRRQLADQFLESCYETDKILSLVNFLSNYSNSGHSDIAKDKFLEEIEGLIVNHHAKLNDLEIQVLYNQFIFILPNLIDSLQNSKLYKIIGKLYYQRIIQPKIRDKHANNCIVSTNSPLRIGFISPHFARHPVGWCSLDVIKELSRITPHIYLYASSSIKVDARTRGFEEIAEKYYWYNSPEFEGKVNSFDHRLNQLLLDIYQDQLDVLIDLDSVTLPLNTHLLCHNLATVSISWLGFDAPFISSDNYWFGDRFTHPEGIEQYYTEKIVRLPDAHMAVSGFASVPSNRDDQRQRLGIEPQQIVYLYAAPGRKFNRDSARACIDILQRVPDSILLHKGSGDHEVIGSIYHEFCNDLGVDPDRVKFLPSYKTEEEHRSIYAIADIFLDSYPYNGGSHNLEVLWFNLPVVTRVGKQSFARMGYSFLQALGIDEGIAHSWEEYVKWGIRYGLDTDTRNAVRQKLIMSKDPKNLAPLWNPKKLAQDMYSILRSLLDKS